MTKKKPSKGTLKEDREALIAFKKLTTYLPPSPDLSIEAVCLLEQRLREKEELVVLATKELKTCRGGRDNAMLALHSTMQRIKTIVRGQYGPNSDEVESLGLKKKDDYENPGLHRKLPESH